MGTGRNVSFRRQLGDCENPLEQPWADKYPVAVSEANDVEVERNVPALLAENNLLDATDIKVRSGRRTVFAHLLRDGSRETRATEHDWPFVCPAIAGLAPVGRFIECAISLNKNARVHVPGSSANANLAKRGDLACGACGGSQVNSG